MRASQTLWGWPERNDVQRSLAAVEHGGAGASASRAARAASSAADLSRPVPVLHVIHSLPLGGAESQVVTLASSLGSDRYAMHVCCLRKDGAQAQVLRARDIPVVSLNMRVRYWPAAVFRLVRLMKQLQPRIVHTHMHEAGIWGGIAARLAGVPVVIATEHSVSFARQHHAFIERLIDSLADARTAVSDEIRQCYIESHLASPAKVLTIPNAVQVERFAALDCRDRLRAELGTDGSSPLIGTVARLVEPKRLDILLRAARVVCDCLPAARFVVVGDGPLRGSLEQQAEQLGLARGQVTFLGSRQDIPELLSALDIFVLSSEWEGLPVSLLEAMAASKPVVATRVGAIPQVVEDGRNGLLVPSLDPAALADAILGLLRDSAFRQGLARAARQTVVERFSTAVICKQMTALYDSLLEQKARRRVS